MEFETLSELPVLNGAIAQIACEVVSEHVEGDHTLFVGRVMDLRLEDKNPLLFFSGKYRKLTELEIIES